MQLSVIIVSYNVQNFLYQALHAVERAIRNLEAEVWVVDNASTDSSVEMVQKYFPNTNIIANKNNLGFAQANNQAIKLAKGEYILLLNPDTVVAEDTFEKCLMFFNQHPDAGALGVHMIAGNGIFLPESKRGLPTPQVACYKMIGLSKIFKNSTKIGAYHQSFLPKNKNAAVPILSGAFMFVKSKALQKIGLLDEQYFMYGEDIDLSYRLILGGYQNYYFADTTIIHYKGESTKKNSVNYVIVFYKAMLIFANQYFAKGSARFLSIIINVGIIFRATLALLHRAAKSIWLFAFDAILSLGFLYLLTSAWEIYIKSFEYPIIYYALVQPLYVLIWLLSLYFGGGYDKPYRSNAVARGILVGTLTIGFIYAFLPDELRFSRAIILLGTVTTVAASLITRFLAKKINIGSNDVVVSAINFPFVVIGSSKAINDCLAIIQKVGRRGRFIGYLTTDEVSNADESFLGTLELLGLITKQCPEAEYIFIAEDVSYKQIIESISSSGRKIEYSICHLNKHVIIGNKFILEASSANQSHKKWAINQPFNKRNKRLFDILLVITLFIFLPFWYFLSKKSRQTAALLIDVIKGEMAIIGSDMQQRPISGIKNGLISVIDFTETSPSFYTKIMLDYAKYYKLHKDFQIFKSNYKKLFL